MQTVYEAAGGTPGLTRLAAAWHERMLADELGAHPFSHGIRPDHTERLAAYWAEALGGPTTYSERYGDETFVVRIHSGNGPHEDLDQLAIACFDQALDDVELTGPVRQVLYDYFAWATTTTLARYHGSKDSVPDGLSIPQWTWSGPVS
ncbi:MAG TPA: group II truncated hemoglobin [Mycobacteriales bacterium]|nr:group II truncated hemoglobin [Mycobacteriales bacterium]